MDTSAIPWIDPNHDKNRREFPTEELWKYIGKHVAWSWDGTRIVASGDTMDEVFQQLDKIGIPHDRVVHGFVDDPDVSHL